MRTQLRVETGNVLRATQEIKQALNRPVTELPGLIIMPGDSGYGKSRYLKQTAGKNGWVYYEMTENETAKSLSIELYRIMQILQGANPHNLRRAYGSTAEIMKEVIAYFNQEPNVLIFDEINKPIHNKNWKVLETIRDIVDKTACLVIMSGESDILVKIRNYDKHFSNRIYNVIEFHPNTMEDVQLVVNNVSNVQIDQQTIEAIQAVSRGDLRLVIQYIDTIEQVAAEFNLAEVTYEYVSPYFDKAKRV